MAVIIVMLVAFVGITVFIGLYFRKKSKGVSGFVLGGRTIGPWLAAFAYGTTYFSAVVFVGYAGQFGWKFGTAALWIGLGNAFIGALLPWVILGKRTRVMTQHLKSSTMPQFFGSRYNSDSLKIGASLIVFVFMIPYSASLYNGLSRIFSVAFNIDFIYCIIGMAVLTMVYVIVGGYLATAVNDFVQGLVMLVGIVAVVAAVLSANGGFTEAINSLANIEVDNAAPGALTSFFGPDPLNLLGVVLLTSLGTWGLPQIVHKFYVIKSEQTIRKGAIISTIFALVVSGGCYFIGSFGRLYADSAAKDTNGNVVFDSIVPNIIGGLGSDFLIGLVIVLVLAASMSTLAGLVMSSSSTLTLDFLKGRVVKNMSEKSQLITIRALVAVFVAVSAGIAVMQFKSSLTFIAQLMGISWGALAGSFLAPFLYGLYWKRTSKAAVWSCFGFSTAWMTFDLILNLTNTQILGFLQSPINSGAFVMLAGLVIVPLVSAFTKPPAKETVDNCFAPFPAPVAVTAALETTEGAEDAAGLEEAKEAEAETETVK